MYHEAPDAGNHAFANDKAASGFDFGGDEIRKARCGRLRAHCE
ncbi:MAG TPA: hypothetical protein VH107_11985 [Lacipirellulaceae bacterium]|jgi:hypothetical protein|nr:hypothetical protein [Lacipirellulaceae bacterium]